MKFLITENKLEKIIFNFLDTYIDTINISRPDNFIVIYNENLESDNIEGNWTILFEYVYYDGGLFINYNWLNGFLNMFSLELKEGLKIIEGWFENKFNVEVYYIES